MKINLVIVRNEERSLERCLKKRRTSVDDIIIVYQFGSQDRTKEIATQGAPGPRMSGPDDFSAARNFAGWDWNPGPG